jgi:predicted DNA-binding protein (MmcQ/YjbR family)
MTLETLREYCLSKPYTSESTPFGPETLVFKVGEKAFLLTGWESEILKFNVKCDPEWAIELREQYDFVIPGYHMNKKHWNTVTYNGTNSKLLKQLIDHSYELVAKGTKKKQ